MYEVDVGEVHISCTADAYYTLTCQGVRYKDRDLDALVDRFCAMSARCLSERYCQEAREAQEILQSIDQPRPNVTCAGYEIDLHEDPVTLPVEAGPKIRPFGYLVVPMGRPFAWKPVDDLWDRESMYGDGEIQIREPWRDYILGNDPKPWSPQFLYGAQYVLATRQEVGEESWFEFEKESV